MAFEVKVPIKTQVITAICQELERIEEIREVHPFQGRPLDLALQRSPVAWVFDSVPELRSRSGRWAQGVMELEISVFIELSPVEDPSRGNLLFSQQCDIIQQRLHDTFFATGHDGLRCFVIAANEKTVEKAVTNDSWGVLKYVIDVTYRHKLGDGFSLDKF